MRELLGSLPHTLSVISGSHNDQMAEQLDGLPLIRMGQNGNHVLLHDATELWFDRLTQEEKDEIMTHAEAVWAACTHEVPDKDDLFEDRGSQISLSLYGHKADPSAKKAFDGDFRRRAALLKQFPFKSEAVEVKMGGSTCFDYFRKGRHKGYNVARLIEHMDWNKDECLFFGDALFPGGNDETVIGVIETVAVTDHEDTYAKLRELLTL